MAESAGPGDGEGEGARVPGKGKLKAIEDAPGALCQSALSA